MRAEFLQRFQHQFEKDGGFRILLDSGFHYSNTHYNYIPTYTGPGHASISTGTTPKYHGIVANDWLDTRSNYEMYCVEDTTVRPVGTVEYSSRRSPKNLRTLTFSDGIKLHTNGRGKSFGVSIKDREARELNLQMQPIWNLFDEFTSFRVTYAALNLMGITQAQPARPVLPLGLNERQKVEKVLREMKLL